jgi:hypothetical protein
MEDHTNQHEHEHKNDNNLHETQKLKALISHWIEHNTGHLEKIREHAKIAEDEGASEVATHLNDAVNHMQKAIDALELALKNL